MAKVPRHEIAKVLAERSLSGATAQDLSNEIAAYLTAEHRTAELEPLLRDIIEYRAEQGIVEVVAATAHPLDAAARKDIEAQVKNVYPAAKKIIISEDLQSALVGGIRLEFPAQQLDLTVRARLSRFKQLTTA